MLTIAEKRAVMKAFYEGATIEFKQMHVFDSEWLVLPMLVDRKEFKFDWERFSYRIRINK